MIVQFEMRTALPFGEYTKWVEFCGWFSDWVAFGRFVERETYAYRRNVRAAKEVGEGK